jgi:murein L,D-transpeptidase YafK
MVDMHISVKTILLITCLAQTASAHSTQKVDLVVVNKSERELILMSNGIELKSYRIALGKNPVGHKKQEGDKKTPEGRYVLDYKKPDSAFYKAIHISYPNAADIAQAQKRGVSPGGFIMIHGQKNGFGWLGSITQQRDWTEGCIAVKNSEMEEIWQLVDINTPIQINP